MNWIAMEMQENEESKLNAGGKARNDISTIALEQGIEKLEIVAPQRERAEANIIKKAVFHYIVARKWEAAFKSVRPGDTVIIQFPVVNHTLLFNRVIKKAKKRGIKIVAFIHDLETIRFTQSNQFSLFSKWRMRKDELDELYSFEKIVVLNKRMKEYLHDHFHLPEGKMIVLDIWDYLIPEFSCVESVPSNYKSCIIAGNLTKEKAGYVYQLPQQPDFELFGICYSSESKQGNIHYHGSFDADELPSHLIGGFGLVWDGDSIETCAGAWGNYLRYNNPHKTSLYLACGIPVIIWREAALAQYIIDHQVGLTIDSLEELEEKVNVISLEDYNTMKKNAEQLSVYLKSGYYIKRALNELIN